MFPDYKAQVTFAYKKKSAAGMLSLNLLHSTPAKLRAECVMVLNERYLKKDEPILRVFFGPRDDAAGYMQTIRKFDADKFKPLDNFLKSTTNDTEDKNIELLAWLIDFEPRPYKYGQANTASETKKDESIIENESKIPVDEIINSTSATPGLSLKEISQIKNTYNTNSTKNALSKTGAALKIKTLILVIVIALISLAIFLILHYKTKSNTVVYTQIIGKQKCMYWAGDNYQLVSCDQKHGDTPVFALDTFRLTHFKRITRPDTISLESLGKFWYFKAGDTLQVYNCPGAPPMFADRRLVPLSEWMLNKYILHKKQRR